MKAESLIGKTIVDAEYMKSPLWDDEPYLVLTFSDGTEATVFAAYGGYTGASNDEYPAFISLLNEKPEGIIPTT